MLNSFQYLNNEISDQARNDNIKVTLKIYDLLGHEIVTLVNEQQKPEYYEVKWNAINQTSGVFFYQLLTDNLVETKTMVLLR